MTIHTPLFMQPAVSDAAITYTAQEFRQYVRAQLTVATGVGGEQGVTAASSYQVTQRGAGANLSVDVAAGLGYVVGDDLTNQGTYQLWNDGVMNVTGWTVPGSGTFHHRLCLQAQDKLSGSYAGYTGNLVPVLDTGGGLPAELPSAITLATIDIPTASGSITNSMINDYRTRVGPVQAARGTDLARTHSGTPVVLTDDPVLQLLNLQPNATYELSAALLYTGGTGGGDLTWTWRESGGTTLGYVAPRVAADSSVAAGLAFTGASTPSALSQGGSSLCGVGLNGTISTGAAPAYAVLQWSQNTDSGNSTTMKAGSYVRARRLN